VNAEVKLKKARRTVFVTIVRPAWMSDTQVYALSRMLRYCTFNQPVQRRPINAERISTFMLVKLHDAHMHGGVDAHDHQFVVRHTFGQLMV
jgi:hypothetical protein